ncbi:MAG: PaaI family thioesterase [Microbacteriaceae bacterium]
MTDSGSLQRRRVITWQDPAPGARQIPSMSGLEYVQALRDGIVPPPPIAELMRMTLTDADVGTATFVCEPDESHYNPIGTVHGGLVCTLLDSALGCAVQTTLPQGQGYTSVDINVSYLRPVHAHTGQLTCVGTVVKPGSRIAFAEAKVTDAAGRVLATATSTLLVFALAQ